MCVCVRATLAFACVSASVHASFSQSLRGLVMKIRDCCVHDWCNGACDSDKLCSILLNVFCGSSISYPYPYSCSHSHSCSYRMRIRIRVGIGI